ncbi:uncharacterized protein AMSG_00307 [Thecamonas trahens ATCC 50062]|uniref:Sulfotransferase n=1 Tax=Thecamonas trahens ATCC 50062 TaxID=461836 RepID=A0A0L0D4G1_THETB|nr:hypothetical protein AMSG_00307 [Thecamonas trahens ATCC 50062]KNC46188.1 hypothetical protein AMSG_00307 [Thecamonas trahens ATCC 50062]|eukprot:XP_013763163.1 hypothetical protein AMSG_00307 [Thecamonas trahens ATCC 50062]
MPRYRHVPRLAVSLAFVVFVVFMVAWPSSAPRGGSSARMLAEFRSLPSTTGASRASPSSPPCSPSSSTSSFKSDHECRKSGASQSGRQRQEGRRLLGDEKAIRAAAEAYMDVVRPEMFNSSGRAGIPDDDDDWLDGYASPCWLDDGGGLRCMPAFMILGVFQAGVKDVYLRMGRHPAIHDASGLHILFWCEPHKWEDYAGTMSRVAEKHLLSAPDHLVGEVSPATFEFMWAQSTDLLRPTFAKAARECWTELGAGGQERTDAGRDRCIQESRAAELEFARAHGVPAGRDETLSAFTTPYLVRAAVGTSTKLIVVLRNPADRLYAAYNKYGQYDAEYGFGPDGFDAYLDAQLTLLEECIAKYSRFKCALEFEAIEYRYQALFYHADQIIKSMYGEFLPEWLAAFPEPSALLVVTHEEYVAGPKRVLARVFDHVGVDSTLTTAAWDDILEGGPATLNGQPSRERQPMHAATRARLDAFFAPDVAAIADYVGDDSLWRE